MIKYSLMMAGLCAGFAGAQEAPFPYVETANGQRIEGSDIRAKSDGTIVLRTETGNQELALGSYRVAYSAPPRAELTKAQSLMAQGEAGQAAAVYAKIIDEQAFLGWDLLAMEKMSEALVQEGKAAEALAAYEKLLSTQKHHKKNPKVVWPYWGTIISAGKADTIADEINGMVKNKNRAIAAKAQILRGDIAFQEKKYRDAILDYLRTVTLFKSVKPVQAEALYKTGVAFEQLRDARAKDFFQQVVDEYPTSSYKAAAEAKL